MADSDEFDPVLREALREETAPSPPPVLYHYTGLEGAMKIIESDAILASDIRFLNDSLEHQFAWKLIQGIGASLEKSVQHEITRELLRHVARLPATHLSFSGGAFISSFSHQPDLLSQWRAYADDGRGVALGFATSAPLHPVGAETHTLPFRRVLYDSAEQLSALKPHVESVIQVAEKLAEQGDPSVRDRAASALLKLAALLGTTIKNPAFSEECEWRIVASYIGPMAPLSVTKVRRGRAGLVPYCELRAKVDAKRPALPLKEIVVGPRFDGLQMDAFITYLATHGYAGAMPGLLVRQDLSADAPTVVLKRSSASYR